MNASLYDDKDGSTALRTRAPHWQRFGSYIRSSSMCDVHVHVST
jgi:hypothetical protein